MMKTSIKEQVIESLPIGVKFLADSSCWNYHKAKLHSIRASVNKKAVSLFNENPELKNILVVVGVIGRGGHTQTVLHLFNATGFINGVIGTKETAYRNSWIINRNAFKGV